MSKQKISISNYNIRKKSNTHLDEPFKWTYLKAPHIPLVSGIVKIVLIAFQEKLEENPANRSVNDKVRSSGTLFKM